ncbi:uncharacterized protein LOC128883335 [Hylaeus volcanicus]|uniref:uncharacterized protein LOC128883335 n=1 Tax=Hylaeus volcanicus TaxID=313075 RepID=UPI0023B80C2D|nr:uncharacterized protein LOC128883335 [Hylaeus volcanicus]
MGKKNKKLRFDESVTFNEEEIETFSKNDYSDNNSDSSDSDNILFTRTKSECCVNDHEEDSSDDSKSDFEQINTEFEFFDPDEKFYHTVRHFCCESVVTGLSLQTKGSQQQTEKDSGEKNSVSESVGPLPSRLANIICDQGNIGTVICVSSDTKDDSPVGFATVLNFTQYHSMGLKELKLAILNMARKRLNQRHFRVLKDVLDPHIESTENISRNKRRLLQKKGIPLPVSAGGIRPIVGLFLNERLVNLPHEIVPTLLDNLCQDVAWSQTTSLCPENERSHYFFTHLVGLSHCFILSTKETINKSQGKTLTTPTLAFKKFEDEIFLKHSLLHFTLPTRLKSRVASSIKKGSRESLEDVTEHRLVFLIDYKKVALVVEECKDIVNGLTPSSVV